MIVVRKIAGLATVQDLGRPGRASEGLPPSGVLVRAFADAANAAAGNDERAACIEVFGRFACVAESDVTVADDRGARRILRAGEELDVGADPTRRVRYLAIAGGVAAPELLGSRSTLASCGLGRALRRGDRIESQNLPMRTRPTPPPITEGPIRIVLGPDPGGEPLFSTTFRISTTSDRTGTRLEGTLAVSAKGTIPSSPTVVGAIQLPQNGAPIVIGPDGPVTGGYPIIAVIARADRDRFHALPLGATVSFALFS